MTEWRNDVHSRLSAPLVARVARVVRPIGDAFDEAPTRATLRKDTLASQRKATQ